MAVLNRGISKQQYMRVDEKVLHWIGVRKPANESPSNLGYQSLLLALSDQMLAVGLCYLIAMYAQVCKVSLYSFMMGVTEGFSLQPPSQTCETSSLPMAVASHSQPDLSGTAGFGTGVDSMTRWMTPRRTTTTQLEEGKRVSCSCFLSLSYQGAYFTVL